jgi:hypothetical protein
MYRPSIFLEKLRAPKATLNQDNDIQPRFESATLTWSVEDMNWIRLAQDKKNEF